MHLGRYSFNFGSAHFVSVNTETDYPEAPNDKFSIGGVGNGGFGDQLRWLEEDLRVRDQNPLKVEAEGGGGGSANGVVTACVEGG